MSAITLILTDDQALFRQGLRTLLSVYEELSVIGEAADGDEAVELVLAKRPDVILMDLRMPRMGGAEATRRIVERYPEGRIIVLTTFDDDEDVYEALRAGAIGYLLKDVSGDTLVEAIRSAARGESFLQPSIAAKVVAEFARLSGRARPSSNTLVETLSGRELEILRLLTEGLSNKEIGQRLDVVEGTVKNHMTNILGKLGVSDRTQAALKARELGLA